MKFEFYPTWYAMMSRCYKPTHHNYPRYGARGITVCKEWQDYKTFELWAKETVGSKSNLLTLDRIDNDKGYSPDNCRWVSMKVQSNNRSSNTLYSFNGETLTFTQWCEKFNISDDVVWERINRLGWEPYKAFSTPLSTQPSKTRHIVYNGESHNLTEWCRILKVPHSTVYARMARGFSVYEALVIN